MWVLGLFFVPDEALSLLLAAAGICLMVGARQLAVGIVTFALTMMLLPLLLVPLVEVVPLWVLWLFFGYLVFLLPFFAVSLLQFLVSPALGKKAASEMGGHLAADMTKALLLGPFQLLGFIARMFIRIFSRQP